MSRCLVTGATGFIGPRLVAQLQQAGHEAVCLVRSSSKTAALEELGVELVLGDVTQPDTLPAALEGVDAVYHLAGLTHAPKLEQYLAVNEAGTAHLAQASAAQVKPPVLLVVSSLAAAGPSPVGMPHTEATPAAPVSNYGTSKLAGEQAARVCADHVPTTILRPPVVFGPGDRDGLKLFKAIKSIRIHLVPNMSGLPLSLIHADDLAAAMIKAANQGERLVADASSDAGQGIYYAADPAASSYAEVGRMAAEAMGVKAWIFRRRKYPFLIPALLGDLKAQLTGKASVFGMDKLREASASGWVCDPSKAMSQLDFAPAASLVERYQQTAEWYRKAGWL